MTAEIIDGKKLAEKIRAGIKEEIARSKEKPGLAAIIVGENPASKLYVGIKQRTCDEVGIYSEIYNLPEATSEEELLKLISKLNNNPKIHGILVQSPTPKHINEETVFNAINLEKDVDGFNPINIGRMFYGNEGMVPCTPKGVIRMLEEYKIPISGKNAVVVGRSKIVGKPTAMLLLNRDATVTVCHRHTKNLGECTKNADILVVAVGKPKLITAEMVKPGAVVIDVGTTKVNGKLVGDVDFEAVRKKAAYLTPVPGGVGPMTVAMLLENTLNAFKGGSQ